MNQDEKKATGSDHHREDKGIEPMDNSIVEALKRVTFVQWLFVFSVLGATVICFVIGL